MKFARLALFVRDYFIAIASFLLIFLLTLFIYAETKKKAEERVAKLFDLRAEQASEAIELRMRDYVQILVGAKALFVASDTVKRSDWRTYYETLGIEQNYPGIQGIGYTQYLRPNELRDHVSKVQREGFPEYKVKPEGKRTAYTSILYLEPFSDRNLRAFGFDMFSEPIRNSAMQMARDTRQPAMSGKVRLVQETGKDEQAGFLIYLPLYRNNANPESIKDRQLLIRGFVYSPFRAKDLISSILGDNFPDLDIELYDGTTMSEKSLLYSTDTTLYFHAAEKRPYSKIKTLNIGNNTWRVYTSARPTLGRSSDRELPYFILLGGTIISFLMFFIIWTLSNSRRSNRLKQTITDNATAAIFILDADGYCTFLNPAAEEMTGYTLKEIRKKPLHEAIHHSHPDGRPFPEKDCALVNSVPANISLRNHEDVFIKKDGTFFNVSCATRPILESGQPIATIIEVRDITDEKRAQQAIVESEARFRTMADNAPVKIWMADAWGQSVYVNKQWQIFSGQSWEESLNFGWLQAIDKQDMPYFESVYKEARAEATSFRLEMRLRRHDGQPRWAVATGNPRFGAQGEFLGHIGTIIDITEIKEAERKVKQNAELLQKLFLEVPALVALVRAPDQQYVLVNPMYRKLYGNRQLVGKTLREAHPDMEGQGFYERLDDVFGNGKPFVGKEVPSVIDRNSDGELSTSYFNLVYQPLMDGNGNVEAILIFAVEVTELVTARKKLSVINDELSRKNKELQRINNDLDNFVYTASHDLKSPIANMEGLTALLRDILQDKLVPEDAQLLDRVSSSIEKLKQTVADLAEITKVQKDLQSSQEPLVFEEMLEDITTDLSEMVKEANARIEANFGVQGIVYARKNLRSIIYNLVSNAIKYRSPDRPVEVLVDTYLENDAVVLRVQDNGLGIKKEQQHKLFSMFKRLHTHVEGTGIGLYIVKRIIENNGGSIEVSSELGKGTTFKIYFKQAPVKVAENQVSSRV